MSEETTERLGGGDSFEARVLRALAAINGRLDSMDSRLDSMDSRLATVDRRLTTMDSRLATMDSRSTLLEEKIGGVDSRLIALEEKVDARLRETRPIWEAVLARLDIIDSKFDVFALDMIEIRAETNLLKKRLPPAA